MASAANLTDAPPADAAAPRRKGLGLASLLILLLLSAAATGAAVWFLTRPPADDSVDAAAGQTPADAIPAPAAYLSLEPAFVVNLEDPDLPHYLQVDVQLMSRDAAALESVRMHAPRIRNGLLLLFAQQKPADLSTRAGKEALRAAALEEVQKAVLAETGQPVVEAVYFTSFVMQ